MKAPSQRFIVGAALAACAGVLGAMAWQEKEFRSPAADAVIYYRGLGLAGDSWLGHRVTRIENATYFTRATARPEGKAWIVQVSELDGRPREMATVPRSTRNAEGIRIPDLSSAAGVVSRSGAAGNGKAEL